MVAYQRVATFAHDDSDTEVYEYVKYVDERPVRWLVEVEGPLLQDVRAFEREADADRFLRSVMGPTVSRWVTA